MQLILPRNNTNHQCASLETLTLDECAAGVHVVIKNDGGGHNSQQKVLCLAQLDPARENRVENIL